MTGKDQLPREATATPSGGSETADAPTVATPAVNSGTGEPQRQPPVELSGEIRDVRTLLQPYLSIASAPAGESLGPIQSPRVEIVSLSDVLDGTTESARQLCKSLKANLPLKNDALECLQRGDLARWLNDHPQLVNQIVAASDAEAATKSVHTVGKRRVPITRRWWQYIAPAIQEDQKTDAKAEAAPDRVEIYLDRVRTDGQWRPDDVETTQQWTVVLNRTAVLYRTTEYVPLMITAKTDAAYEQQLKDAGIEFKIVTHSAEEIYLPDNPEQWAPADIEVMCDRTVLLYPLKTEASWEHARSASQILQTVAEVVRIIPSSDLSSCIQTDLGACELWTLRLCRCQTGDDWTIGDEHFQKDCKKHQHEQRLAGLATYQADKAKAKDLKP